MYIYLYVHKNTNYKIELEERKENILICIFYMYVLLEFLQWSCIAFILNIK